MEAGNNIHLDTDTLEAKKDMTENSDNYIRTYRKTETANTLAAGKTITLAAGENLSARNTTVLSENGQITVAAKGDVNLENGYNESRDDYGLKYKERGLLSSKTTTIKSHDESKTVTASTLSGDAVQITAGGNTNMTGSQVIGTHDVEISSGKDTSISSAEEYERHDYAKQVKKSGLLSGGGLGFTIGTEKRKDQYAESRLMQKGSLIGSAKGNLSISSSGQTQVEGSTLVAGKDMTVIGENISISSKDNVYTSTESHEYKKSGLTVALGGALVNTAESIVTLFILSKRITKIMIKCILSLSLGIISFFIVIIITLIVDIFAVTVFDLLRKPLFICDYHILGYSIDSIFILIGAILGEFSFGGAIMHYLNKENTLLFIPVQIVGLFTFYYLIFFFSPKCDMTYITFELSQVHVVGYAIALSCFWLIRKLKKMK